MVQFVFLACALSRSSSLALPSSSLPSVVCSRLALRSLRSGTSLAGYAITAKHHHEHINHTPYPQTPATSHTPGLQVGRLINVSGPVYSCTVGGADCMVQNSAMAHLHTASHLI